jgi:hypothetical protein
VDCFTFRSTIGLDVAVEALGCHDATDAAGERLRVSQAFGKSENVLTARAGTDYASFVVVASPGDNVIFGATRARALLFVPREYSVPQRSTRNDVWRTLDPSRISDISRRQRRCSRC